jgi:hypothetical protein
VQPERAPSRDDEQERELAAPAALAATPASPAIARILALQRGAGNAAVTRLLQRDSLSGNDYMAARKAKEEWVRGGVRGPLDFVPSTNRGGFQVAYVPDVASGALNVTLKGAVKFVDGIELIKVGGVLPLAVARQPTAQVQAAATAINAMAPNQREAAVAAWHWDAAAQREFLQNFESSIHDAWQRKFQFHNTREFWGDLGADVNVLVNVRAGDKAKEDHLGITSYKIADGAAAGTVGVVRSKVGTDAHDNEMELNSGDVKPRTDIKLTRTAGFTAGTDTLDPAGAAVVTDFATRFQNAGGPLCGTCGKEISQLAGTRINLKVQGAGAEPEVQAKTRFDKLVAALATAGMTGAAGRCDFAYDGVGEQATLVVGTGSTQTIASHEAGHMFGLQDEYTAPFTSSSAGPLGQPTDPGLGAGQGLPGGVRENTDSIMSVGNAVKPQHYATFLEGLKFVTGMTDWAFGPPTGVVPPGVDGPPNPNSVPGGKPAQPATALA